TLRSSARTSRRMNATPSTSSGSISAGTPRISTPPGPPEPPSTWRPALTKRSPPSGPSGNATKSPEHSEPVNQPQARSPLPSRWERAGDEDAQHSALSTQHSRCMQPALVLLKTLPAAGATTNARHRAVVAADARVAMVEQRVVGHAVVE